MGMKVLKHLKAKTQIAGPVLYLVSSLQEKKKSLQRAVFKD